MPMVGASPLFPLTGEALAELPSPEAPVERVYLPPATDENYQWV